MLCYHFLPCLKAKTGFHSDLNATYPVGEIDEDSKKLLQTTRQCLDEAIRICKPGALFRDIGKIMSVFSLQLVSQEFTLVQRAYRAR
jgi:methionine aminopeptidase